jgi:hypothetical protein
VFWGAAFVALTAGNLEAVAEFTARSRENGWTGWQPDAIEGGAALLAGELDKAEAHFNAAMPHLSTRVSAVFSAMRSGEVDPAARAALDAMGTYGPPGAARWSTEVLIGDLDAAFETAWQDLRVVAPQLARQHGGPGNAERLELAPPIRGDWWFGDVRVFRQDPRFVELMTAVGLMDFWRVNGWPDLCAPEGDGLRCR